MRRLPRILHSKRRTVAIIKAKRNAVIEAEIVFSQVAMQMLFATVLIDALHAAFENREIAFD